MAIDYEAIIVKWVEARLQKRRVTHGEPSEPVKEWVKWLKDNIGESDYGDAPATENVISWIAASIEDPNWPTSSGGPP